MSDHDHHHHDDHHHDDHHHGHENDQGLSGALRYLRHAPQMWRSEINDAVIDLVAPISGEVVVDVGAGMGPGTMLAAGRGASVTAVEPTPFLRRILTLRRALKRRRNRITVLDGAAEHLPVSDAAADAVWAVNTMHHWVNVDDAVAELARVLKPGGRVVLVDEDFTNPDHPDHERFGRSHDGDDGDHHGFTMVDATAMGDRLRQVGLVDVEAAERPVAGRPAIVVTASAADA